MQSSPRPDLIAHNEASQLSISEIVSKLADLIGHKLTAYIGGGRDVRIVKRWIAHEMVSSDAEERLRFAYRVVRMLSEHENPAIIQSWLIGLNPELGDRAPAKLFREADLNVAGPEIIAAARLFSQFG